jgi:hypothetical protein
MAMEEPGLDTHEWETEWQALEPLVIDSPAEALPELGDLVERMLIEAGYPIGTPDPVDDEGIDPELLVSFRAAQEITRQIDRGETVDPGDIGLAVGIYREIYEHLLARARTTG